MSVSDIVIKGAREHNLRDIDLVLPRNKLICLTGVSGSGKSSLAFDTLYAEGQRRYVESLSSFARQFVGQMPKPDVDLIDGLSPSISISQKSAGNNPRSTVGTVTEIYDYLRVLYARVGQGHCPECGREITAQTREQILASILQMEEETRFSVLAPLIRSQKGEYRDLFVDLLKQGFVRARVDGRTVQLNDDLKLDRQMRHDIEVVVDRLVVRRETRARLAEAVELALKIGKGNLIVAMDEAEEETPGSSPARRRKSSRPGDIIFSVDYACTHCGISFEPPSPQLFSFNSPQGMCLECDGLGRLHTFDPNLLIPDPRRSFKKGCFELIGRWKDMGRWRRHIYQGVANTVERVHCVPPGTMLEQPWNELPPELQKHWLWGTEDLHITYTWRGGSSPLKYGGQFEGIIPQLLAKYRSSKSRMQLRQLEKYMSTMPCGVCHGERLNPQARAVSIASEHPRFADSSRLTLPQVCALSVAHAVDFFDQLVLNETSAVIAEEAIKEIRARLQFLMNVGLDYLALDRTAPTLSGGESQRIRLAAQIGSGLVGVLYILDEPSIGLHARDNNRLIDTLGRLRDMGNTVIVVEHDEDTMRAADMIVDFGPGPGVRGGDVVVAGTPQQIVKNSKSLTGKYLSGKLRIDVPQRRRIDAAGAVGQAGSSKNGRKAARRGSPARAEDADQNAAAPTRYLEVIGASHNNLKNIDVAFPLGTFICVTGVSGSGKSSLVNDILVEALRRDLNRGDGEPGAHRKLQGLDQLDKMIAIDQSPIGRTPRSNPGTYIKVFDDIRNLFAQLSESKRRGYKPGRFSFNVSGGRCEACEGNGSNRLEMDFLADIWITCPVCSGHRYNRETLRVQFKNKSIADVLEMDVQEALDLFENIPKVRHKLQTLHDVGLDYLKLGQPSPTLSGGEAQRIKLARELVKKSTGQTLYLLDEPTTGLHFADIKLLLKVLHDFVAAGNTVLVVEHNLEVIKTADWIIDLGPEGGEGGGELVACGTPEQITECEQSHTGRALRQCLRQSTGGSVSGQTNGTKKRSSRRRNGQLAKKIQIQGAQQHNLKCVDTQIHRDKMTVFCGPSGSGKSSLAMDTIYAEGQRRYVESLSAYARQFVNQMQKPKLDHIDGLSPAIAIEQKNLGSTPRSTVGTVTEVYDYLRILFARLGTSFCPDCEVEIGTQTSDQVVDKIMGLPDGTRLFLMAPVDVEVGQQYDALWDEMRAAGYVRVRVDGQTYPLDSPPKIDRRRRHQVEVVVDRVITKEESRSRIADSVENTLSLGRGVLHVAFPQKDVPEPRWQTVVHSQHLACEGCGRSFEPLTPHNFSFNSHLGWCESCEGLGTEIGANPAALIRDPKLTLAEGAVNLWPNLARPVSASMLAALAAGTGLPTDVPFDQLAARHRRIMMHGAGDQWFAVRAASGKSTTRKPTKAASQKSATGKVMFEFQYKGLYPALEEASRLSPSLRARLEQFVDEVECTTCDGSRLRDDAAAVRFRGRTIDELCRLPLGQLDTLIHGWKMSSRDRKIAGEVIREARGRIQFLNEVGLDYLTLGRNANTLSNGEAQRIRLASQLGSGLCGVLYVLDEPTIGLHPRDNTKLLGALKKLRDLGNTLVVVEHDREVIEQSDFLCDFGPGAGRLGGQIVAQGTPGQAARRRTSVTGPYLNGKKSIPVPANRRMRSIAGNDPPEAEPAGAHSPGKVAISWLEIRGARHNNLRDVDLRIPLGTFTAITGPSGCGKSSLIDDVLYASLARTLHRAATVAGAHDSLDGLQNINKVIRVDQQPLGNSPTSNPATYTGVFELIRLLFAQLPEAKLRGYSPRRFSFNVPGGRCEECEGNGQICIEMHFLPDVWVRCDTCHGKRYNPETLGVTYRGHSISDVLDMTCGQAVQMFDNIPKVRRILQTLCDVGLDYLTLGQPAPTLSGGEAQRVKLAAELSRPDTGRTLYLLDEPTTGLHFDDLTKLLEVLHRLVDLGNTVVVIEHNLDVIKQADWVVDMGPEAGDAGGLIVAEGTPEDVVAHAVQWRSRKPATKQVSRKPDEALHDDRGCLRSHTGEALEPVLTAGPYGTRKPYDFAAEQERQEGDLEIAEVGRNAKMPWEVSGRQWHTRDRVGRRGEPCRWDGEVLGKVVDCIQESGEFSETDWNNRSVVEIAAVKKTDGWFFHAITGEAWLLKMKIRTLRGTFNRAELVEQLGLKSLNQIDEIPMYGNEPRVKCKTLRGPFQEVEVRVHSMSEIDKPPFWKFLQQAVNGFQQYCQRAGQDLESHMPWKKLGQRWHFMRKGFPPGKKIQWQPEVLEELYELLCEVAPDGQFLWNNQILVHLIVPQQKTPWATVFTKRPQTLDLMLNGPKSMVALGRVFELGCARQLDESGRKIDHLRISFRTVEDLHRGDLLAFLLEHREQVDRQSVPQTAFGSPSPG